MHIVRFDGQKLRDLREGRKWDQMRLATEARQHGAGVTQSTVSRLEAGKHEPTLRTIAALAAALGVDEVALLVDDDPFRRKAA